MSKKTEEITIQGRFFRWLVYRRGGTTFYADGRSGNSGVALKRYSLETDRLEEARENLKLLDLSKAIELGQADAGVLDEYRAGTDGLSLEEGKKKYLAYVARPPVMGGAGESTTKRYRAVFAKFIEFAQGNGVTTWSQVGKGMLEKYGTWLDEDGYAYASEYLELTTLKQAMKWMIGEKLIPKSCGFELELKKPQGTSTYCYTAAEVAAMIIHCHTKLELKWLGDVIVALTHTGLRIGELATLRWSDLDEDLTKITLVDERQRAVRQRRAEARATKTHRDRTLPVHENLREVLSPMKKKPHRDGRVFHGPGGGILKPDTLRNILKRDVLTPLAKQFPSRTGLGIADGRLHSFRHYFCSIAANGGVPEQILMTWLGHRDSRMVKHYYHLHEPESRRQMDKIDFAGTGTVTLTIAQSA